MPTDSGLEQVMLVDGHSLIFAWEDLRALHRRSGLAARSELARRLRRYADSSGVHVVLVYDGAGMRIEEEAGNGIQVMYSSRGLTADDVIERLVRHYKGHYALSVATRDLAEAHAVMAEGAMVVSPRTLKELLEGEEEAFRARLERQRRRT
ncbi:MAG TPA: NYN domain-containing protein [Verrucomicrobiales bacterium]|nr:NYN domain-containing protein [Verrucomicrobiales bacterium]